MQDTASDAKDVDNFSHRRPHLPPQVSNEEDKRLPPDLDVEDKDADVVADAAGAPHLNTPQDVDPPSRQS